MSLPASVSYRRATRGYSLVPNSIVENQVALTPAELRLTLIVLRRGGKDTAVPVSDTNWESWTGLSPRQKEYAIAGLKLKGLDVEGHGDRARYHFDWERWHSYVGSVSAAEPRARTRGRGVDPKKGAKVHPDCRERGCALLNAEVQSGLSLVPSTEVAQPVAQSVTDTLGGASGGGCTDTHQAAAPHQNKLVRLESPKVAQRVAQKSQPEEWKETMLALTAIFPLVGMAFLVRLLTAVFALFQGVTDSELAESIRLAWGQKRKFQRSEGLFLFTVPEALRLVRARPREGPPDRPGVDYLERARDAIAAASSAVAERPAFAAHTLRLGELQAAAARALDLAELSLELEKLEGEMSVTALGELSGEQREALGAAIEERIEHHRRRGVHQLALEGLRSRWWALGALKALGVPRLTAFY